MPKTTTPLWFLTASLVIGYPMIAERYLTAMAMDGAYPPHGDTIIIPIFGSIVVALVAMPFVLTIGWLCLKRYKPGTSILVWRNDRKLRTALISFVSLPLAIGALFLAFDGILSVRVWEEYLWTGYYLAWAYWILAMRSAYVNEFTNHEF